MTILTALSVFSGICFLIYGTSCLSSPHMAKEFKRFGIPKFLKLTGMLQILGGLALLLGCWKFPQLAFTGSAGLAVLMLLGSIVRIKIKDSFLQSSPAFIFTILNSYLAYYYLAAM
ncbi:DoxX family protein [Flavobacteriaceae bacterium]|nr:DoxX family protein [Flavobacteriaceae bacterium]